MQDPPRPEVIGAVTECHTAGIRIIMITGDYGLTAEAIARKIGIITSPDARVITGAMLDEMSEEDLKQVIGGQVVFARVVPEHKMLIAQTLQSMNEVVAMTGDGVNDAPALKAADIGIAMGKAGTDVAREAADMILTDDNFASIVHAVEEGRAIFDNIRRFLTYFQTSNVAEMVPFMAMIFLGIPLPLTLLQILTIDLLTDQVPALALGLEHPEPGVMERPPKSPGEPILTRGMLVKAYLFLGPIAAAIGMFGSSTATRGTAGRGPTGRRWPRSARCRPATGARDRRLHGRHDHDADGYRHGTGRQRLRDAHPPAVDPRGRASSPTSCAGGVSAPSCSAWRR